MKVFIFGANGMLGRYLNVYLHPHFEVIPITRNEVNLNFDFSLISEKYTFDSSDVIINSAGIIKQRNYSSEELIRVNSLFPHFLLTLNCNIIHITTDCVFSGKDGSYDEDSFHDCLDDYGKSKSLGENPNLTIIRTSIIGEEICNKKSLLEWVKTNKNDTINGYLNHFWNGVTCLELSKHISDIIENNSYWKGVRHYYSPDTVSKYQLVSYINEIYQLGNNVVPIMANYCDRSLKSKYETPITKTIYEQIVDTKNFKLHSRLISGKDKLKNFPTINFISLVESENRRKILYENFEKYGITKIIPHIYERFDENAHNIPNKDVILNRTSFNIMRQYCDMTSYFGALTSHFKAIKEWYENTDEPYALFCEDDLSFETVEYWNFTWEDFFNILPQKWECIQLSLTRQVYDGMFTYFQPEVYLRTRCWDDASCVAYLITRNHAKNLLDSYYDGETFTLKYNGIDYDMRSDFTRDPGIETLIYTLFDYTTVFTFPLFVENPTIPTIVWTERSTDPEQNYSYSTIIDWWKTKGRYFNIKDFKKIE